ncbi:MAG: PAS domain S-box protein [Gemmatimonadales bacterium]|jgi:PAS domain S-box-containing protein
MMPLAVTGSLQALETLRHFVGHLEEGVYVTSAEGDLLDANPALLGIFGVASLEELRRYRVQELWVEPARRAEELAILERDGRVRDFEIQLRRPGGDVRTVLDTCFATEDAASGRTLCFGILVDVTERRRAEAALRSILVGTAPATGDAFFRTLVEHLAHALEVRYAFAGELVDADRERVRTLAVWSGEGITPNFTYELKDSPCEGVVTQGMCCFPRDVQRQFPRDTLLAEMHVEAYLGVPLRDSAGRVLGNLAVMHDRPLERVALAESLLGIFAIRAASELERRLAEQRLSLQSTAMEAVANAICITDSQGHIEWVNPAFTRLTGYEEGEALGQHTRILRSGVMPPSLYADLRRTVQSGRVWRGELVNRRKDGTLYDEEMTITPVPGPDGAATHFVAIKEDVTERHRLEERLRDAQRLEAVGRLAGGVAHDFNNLLQAMLGVSDLLRSGEVDPADQREQLDELEELFHRGGQLTRQLLLFSRREEPKVEACDLNTVVRDTAKLLRRLLRENVVLRMELAEQPLELIADRGQLGQVWMNLAVNAADAMPEGGTLTVRSGRAGDAHVWFSVEDTGHGIADDVRGHIFEPFYTTKRDHRGTGLGLSVVHGIVAGHGGRVEVASAVGRGSAFRVVLPAHGAAGSAAARSGVEARRVPRGKGERLLLVEDNDSVRRTFQRLLSGLGYQVSAVESAEEAEVVPAVAPFDLLLTDVLLPGASGGELARRLRARWPALAVVFMSGYAEDELIRGDVAAGGGTYLQKPVDIEALGRAVRAALDAPR